MFGPKWPSLALIRALDEWTLVKPVLRDMLKVNASNE